MILTGGAAHSELLTGMIEDYAGHIGKFVIMPGENELEALASGADRILRGQEEGRIYLMKLNISNFAKIDNADIIIDGITVIAGENNTGKSTIGKI